jgi:probable HAF family extracellular repeat protein
MHIHKPSERTKRLIARILVVLGVGAQSARTLAACTYSVELIEGPDCQFIWSAANARAINEAAAIAGGYVTCDQVAHHVIWSADNAIITELPPSSDPGYPDVLYDLNVANQVVGELYIPGLPNKRAFLFSNGVTTNLGVLPGGDLSTAHAVNVNGLVCGLSMNSGTGPLQAFLWQDGKMSPLFLPIGPNSHAYDVSDDDKICGWMGTAPQTNAHGFILDLKDGSVIDLGTPIPQSVASEARAISSEGAACGIYRLPAPPEGGGTLKRAFLWTNGSMVDLGVLAGYRDSFALKLNDSNVVVGYCAKQSGASRACIWRNGTLSALNDLVPSELNLDIRLAWSINNAGQIVAEGGIIGSPDQIVFRLTPLPSPIGDFDCNNVIDVDDLLGVINHWGPAAAPTKGSPVLDPADFNQDDMVDLDDLLIVLNNWTM